MSVTFDPYKLGKADVSSADDTLMTNPMAIRDMESYWASLPRSHGVPKRSDLDPVAMGRQLEDSMILERVAPGVARVRVAGRSLGKLVGLEPRGMPLTAFFLPKARTQIAGYVEDAFGGPSIVELPLYSPRAVTQPLLQGRLLLLPLRDELGKVSRLLGVAVMSGRRGTGGRRFDIADTGALRIDPVVGLRAVADGPTVDDRTRFLPGDLDRSDTQKAKGTPALRLVVSNP